MVGEGREGTHSTASTRVSFFVEAPRMAVVVSTQKTWEGASREQISIQRYIMAPSSAPAHNLIRDRQVIIRLGPQPGVPRQIHQLHGRLDALLPRRLRPRRERHLALILMLRSLRLWHGLKDEGREDGRLARLLWPDEESCDGLPWLAAGCLSSS